MELLDKDKVTTTALPSLDDNTTPNAISSAARILGKATRVVVEDVKKTLKVPKKIKGIFTREKLVMVSPEEMTQELGEKEEILQKEIEARQKAEAKAIEVERLRVEVEQQAEQAEAQRQAVEARLMEEQEAREEAEERAAEAEATAQHERQLREQLEAKLKPVTRHALRVTGRSGIAGKDAYEHILIDNAKKELSHENVEVRCAAVRALRQLGNISAPILVETLSKDPSDDVRLNVLASLAALSDKSTLPAFIKCLKDGNPRIRLEAVRGLYQVGDEDSVPFLIEALIDEYGNVRRRAAAYLGRVKNETVVPALISLLQNSTATAREAAIVSLSNIAEEAAIPHLIEALADESAVVRKAALQALRRITKQSFGFGEEMPVDDKRNKRAIGKWRKWWSSKKEMIEG